MATVGLRCSGAKALTRRGSARRFFALMLACPAAGTGLDSPAASAGRRHAVMRTPSIDRLRSSGTRVFQLRVPKRGQFSSSLASSAVQRRASAATCLFFGGRPQRLGGGGGPMGALARTCSGISSFRSVCSRNR